MIRLILAALAVHSAYASFCGDSAVPYSFESLEDGQPVLGCARPTCFGWNYNGLPASTSASFYRINKRPDGFLRNDRASVPPFSPRDARYYQQQTATCEETFQSHNCNQDHQWVAGIAPLLNTSAFPTVLQCCSFEPLRLSSDRGTATVNAGQIVVGGEVLKNGRQYAFDYISDISKAVNQDGTVTYEIAIRRFPCLPLPPKSKSAEAYNVKLEDQAKALRNLALQAPTVQGNAIPLPASVEGPFSENVVVEEIVAQEGVIPDPSTEAKKRLNGVAQTDSYNGDFSNQQQQGGPAAAEGIAQAPVASGYEQAGGNFAQPAGYSQPSGYAQPPPPVENYVQPPQTGYAVAQPAPQPVYYPPVQAAAPAYYGGGGGGGSYYCFTADTTVRTIEGIDKRMDKLQVDDWVQSINETNTIYAPVTFWLHKMSTQKAQFRKIELEDGSVLKLTDKHYIFKAQCTDEKTVNIEDISREAVFAEDVEEGDCLYRVLAEDDIVQSRVQKVSTVEETGIYAPMTSNGKLIVNGVLASCHNIIQSHTLQNSFFSYVDYFNHLYTSIFGPSAESVELPAGMDLVLNMMDYVIPKNIVTM